MNYDSMSAAVIIILCAVIAILFFCLGRYFTTYKNAYIAQNTEEQLRYKSQILTSITQTTEKLLRGKNIYQALIESFELIGNATYVDRVYYFEKVEGTEYLSQKTEWARNQIQPQIDNPLLQKIVLSTFSELEASLIHNQSYITNVSEIKDASFQQMLRDQQILSMLNIPIFVKNTFYGFIGFDDCTQNRIWSIDEVSILQSLATNIASAIERINNEAIIIASENNFRQINETIENVFWLYDLLNHTYLYINPSCEPVLGMSQVDFYGGKSYRDLYVLPEYRSINMGAITILAENDSYELEYQILHPKAGLKWIQEKTFAIRNQQGKLIRVSGICTDITEKITKQHELEHLLAVTNKQNERLTNFAHIISHNIRSHSSNLSGLMELIEETEEAAEKGLYLQMIHKSIDKLGETIQNLNEIITIQNNVNIPKTTLFLKREIATTVNALNAIIRQSHAKVVYDMADDMTINAIPAYLESILLNLLTNAIKYCSAERDPIIIFSVQTKGDDLILAIQDNGLGIDLNKHGHKLFGMYKTFHAHKDARGIGLFITKNQIEAMGGKIEVESELGIGTTFHIYFKA